MRCVELLRSMRRLAAGSLALFALLMPAGASGMVIMDMLPAGLPLEEDLVSCPTDACPPTGRTAGGGIGLTEGDGPTEDPAAAAMSSWYRGMSISSQWNEFYGRSEFRGYVDRIAGINANYITLVIPYQQTDYKSHDIHPKPGTPEDWALIEGIQYIHERCMGVMLKPHMDVVNGGWQANIDAADRDAWFENYGNMLKHYAAIAEEHGVEMIAIGAELDKMTSATWNPNNTERWIELIEELREIYSGKLTYSGQWGPSVESAPSVQFWDHLDYIGLSAFFDLSTATYEVEELEAAWDAWNQYYMQPLHEYFDTPVIFTELGYRNQDGARYRPWAHQQTENNEQEQANLYEAAMSYWSQQDFFHGIFWWEWREGLSEDNTYYSPNDKLAEKVLDRWFGKGITSPDLPLSCEPPATGPGPSAALVP